MIRRPAPPALLGHVRSMDPVARAGRSLREGQARPCQDVTLPDVRATHTVHDEDGRRAGDCDGGADRPQAAYRRGGRGPEVVGDEGDGRRPGYPPAKFHRKNHHQSIRARPAVNAPAARTTGMKRARKMLLPPWDAKTLRADEERSGILPRLCGSGVCCRATTLPNDLAGHLREARGRRYGATSSTDRPEGPHGATTCSPIAASGPLLARITRRHRTNRGGLSESAHFAGARLWLDLVRLDAPALLRTAG
jgi:hypothetical protein